MNCLRTLFSCCSLSKAPDVQYCHLEQAMSPADKQVTLLAACLKRPVEELQPNKDSVNRLATFLHPSTKKTAVTVHTCENILTLVADYAAGHFPKPANIVVIKSSGTHLQKLLIARRPLELLLEDIPPADECRAKAQRFPSIVKVTLTRSVDTTRIPFLTSFKVLRFIWMRDFAFSLKALPDFNQLPQLSGIDITLSQGVDSRLPLEKHQELDLELRSYSPYNADCLFQTMPELTYLHIRDRIYIRLIHVKRLSKECRKYIRTQDPSLPSDEELDKLSDQKMNKSEKLNRIAHFSLNELSNYRFAELTERQIAKHVNAIVDAAIVSAATANALRNGIKTPFSEQPNRQGRKRPTHTTIRKTESKAPFESTPGNAPPKESKDPSESPAPSFAMSHPQTAFGRYLLTPPAAAKK